MPRSLASAVTRPRREIIALPRRGRAEGRRAAPITAGHRQAENRALSQRHAAINQMRLPGDEARLVRGEEGCQSGDLLRRAEPPHRLSVHEGLVDLVLRLAGLLRLGLDAIVE